jgi:hypothetical protein
MCSRKQAMHLRINYRLLLLLFILFRRRLFLLRSTLLFVLFGLLFGFGSTYYRNELPHSSGRSGDYSTWWHPNMAPISIGEYLHTITQWPISANFEFVSLKPQRTTLPNTWKRLITSSFCITLPSHQVAQQTTSFFFKLPYSFNHLRTLTFSLNALMGT